VTMSAPLLRRADYTDLASLPDTLVGEIIDGSLETHPRPHPKHALAAYHLGGELRDPFGRGRGGPGGWVFLPEPELHLGADIVVPDIAGWRRERFPGNLPAAFIEVAPDWVCEILSPSTARLDRGPKRRIYAQAGVQYLWLLDPAAGVLEAFGLAGEQWLLLTTIARGEAVSIAPFDAVSFPLDDLFPFDEPSETPASEA
jgi:Uma2 family endonuclease